MGYLDMQKVTFTNAKGQSILIYLKPFFLNNITGLGDVISDNGFQKAPFQDGNTFIGSVLQSRSITIETTIFGENADETLKKRQEFVSIFNPKLGEGVIRYENDSGSWEIKIVIDGVPSFPSGQGNRSETFQRTLVNLSAPNPYWQDPYITSEPLTAWIGKFKFPFKFPVKFGERANRVTIVNDGDVETPVLIRFKGPATNPVVTNETTGEFIKVNRILTTHDVLEVNTAFGNKTVEIVTGATRTNVFNYIDQDSKFFSLQTGDNIISFGSADVDSKGSVAIEYKKRYLGV